MKIIHHEYRSHPTIEIYKEPYLDEQKQQLEKVLRVALGRLKAWQHIEIVGIKLDEITPHDVADWIRGIFRDDPMYPFVLRREPNRIRVWRVPEGDWKKRARQSLELGADSSEGIIEYINAPRTINVLSEIKKGNQ